MKEFRTRAIINASADVVWDTITNLDAYPKFDPNVIKIEGMLLKRKPLKILYKINPKKVYKITVSELRPIDLMVWEWRWPLNSFKGVRTFTVIAKDDQTTEFQMAEVFSGYLFGIFSDTIPDLSDSFLQFSKGLKRFIESRP